jgi:hypothetical protein
VIELAQFLGSVALFGVVLAVVVATAYLISLCRVEWRRIPGDPERAAPVVSREADVGMILAVPALLGPLVLSIYVWWAAIPLAAAVASYAVAIVARRRIRLRWGSRWIPSAYAAAVTAAALWFFATQHFGAFNEKSTWALIAFEVVLFVWPAASSVVAVRFAVATQRAESPEGDPTGAQIQMTRTPQNHGA